MMIAINIIDHDTLLCLKTDNSVPYLLFLGEEKGVISEDASDRFAEDN